MPIKAVILDVSKTLAEPSGKAVPGAPELISRLADMDVAVFVASNDPVGPSTLAALGLAPNQLLTQRTVGGKKGSKRFVDAVCSGMGIRRNELLYLGDSDNDMREAVNSNVAFFLATWADASYPYGLPVSSPMKFFEIVSTCFLKIPLWYYRLDGRDAAGRQVTVRALLDPDQAKSTGIQALLKQKVGGDTPVGSFTLSEYLSLHLLASIYLEGIHLPYEGQKPIWAIYPGSQGGQQTGVLAEVAAAGSRLFKEKYASSLIYRHQPAKKSAYARFRHEPVTMTTQTTTIHLQRPPPVMGRRVIVLDDFTTAGYGFETSRNLLINAGAADVVCIAVGKYGTWHEIHRPLATGTWDAYAPLALTEEDFAVERISPVFDYDALAAFKAIF